MSMNNAPIQGTSVPTAAIPDTMILVLGLSLIAVSGVTSGQFKKMWNVVWNGSMDMSRADLTAFLGEFIFVLIFAFLAKANADLSQLIFAFFVALWLLWSMSNQATLKKWVMAAGTPPLDEQKKK